LHSRGAWPPGWVPDRELLRLAIVKIDSERTGIEVLYHICRCRTGSRRSASSKPCGETRRYRSLIIAAVSNASDARTRWVATKTLDGRRWIIADTWLPGDWYGYFATWCEADAEARKRNGPHLTVVGEDYTGDDDITF
jgi:hypothetical protein